MPIRTPRHSFVASLAIAGMAIGDCSQVATPTAEDFTVTTLASGLVTPWDLVWGPDSLIWVSERGGRISRVDPVTGRRAVVGAIAVRESGEGGLMGIAFHPDFAHEPYVYAMHTYAGDAGVTMNRLVRMKWDGNALGTPTVLLDRIPGGGIHNGSRIAVGPDKMLYVTTGDAGSSGNAQNRSSLGGKIFRLTPEGRAAPDNPFGDVVWSYGHRNPQGLVFHPTTGVLYSTEHGPNDNDEVNIIRRGGNYGWPDVHGRCDDDVGPERAFCSAHNVIEPLTTWTPTIAPTGADFMSTRIADWSGSLLFTALSGTLSATLSADGKQITSMEKLLSGRFGRLRDVLVAPNGDVYIATSNRDGRGSPVADDDRILRLSAR
jgi:glucose/arabinose dehydrogenase